MKWNFEPTDRTDQQCPHCGLYYSDRGIKAHSSNCPLAGVEHTVVPVDGDLEDPDDVDVETGGGPRTDAGGPEQPRPTDGVGDGGTPEPPTPPNDGGSPEPDVSTDGGLGLEGAPDVDVDDQEESDDVGCCDTPDRRALDEGTPIDLEDGTRVRADPGDELCTACGALVETDGSVRR